MRCSPIWQNEELQLVFTIFLNKHSRNAFRCHKRLALLSESEFDHLKSDIRTLYPQRVRKTENLGSWMNRVAYTRTNILTE